MRAIIPVLVYFTSIILAKLREHDVLLYEGLELIHNVEPDLLNRSLLYQPELATVLITESAKTEQII